ncbi:MAG: TldD/PmbA family protein [Rhodobacteraceae bacterium]|nr:TldD/PmbA family protein [Paracoccaceae bacterium]
MTPLSDLAERTLSEAKRAGADAADVLAVTGTSVSIDVRGGALEEATREEGTDISLRVLIGQRQALVSISDTSPDALQEMADRAVAMAREAPEDESLGLAEPGQMAEGLDAATLDLSDPAAEPDPARLQEMARAAEAAALAVEGVSQTQGAGAGYSQRDIVLAGTNGLEMRTARTGSSLSCVAISGEGTGMERDYDGDSRVYLADLRSAEEIGRTAGERCVARAGAKKPPTGSFPVLFDERVASSLVGHVLQAINGSSVARGASWLRDAEGEQVLPKGMHLIEDPLRSRMLSSRIMDAEGLATARRNWIEDGVLTGYVCDLGTARKLGRESTGNASRGIGSGPSPSTSNIELTQGEKSRDDLVKEMGTGLLITSMIGQTINPNTGDYSRGAAGFWVENGEITYAVNECTVAGNLRDMLATIVPANDARIWTGRIIPSLLVDGLTLAGA